jgi:hypothetical protein
MQFLNLLAVLETVPDKKHRNDGMLTATMKKTGALVRKIFLVLLVNGLACTAFAQTDRASWANLRGLQPGQRIQVAEMTSKKHSGSFVSVSDTAISYRETNGEQSIPKQGVLSVKLMENKHRFRNALIGAAIGAGAGAGIGAASTGRPGDILTDVSRAKGAGVGAILGLIVGGTLGTLLPSHSMIYQVTPH